MNTGVTGANVSTSGLVFLKKCSSLTSGLAFLKDKTTCQKRPLLQEEGVTEANVSTSSLAFLKKTRPLVETPAAATPHVISFFIFSIAASY